MALQYLKGAYRRAEEGHFKRACNNTMGGNSFKLEEDSFRLDIVRKLFIVRVVRCCNSCPERL